MPEAEDSHEQVIIGGRQGSLGRKSPSISPQRYFKNRARAKQPEPEGRVSQMRDKIYLSDDIQNA